MHKKAVTFMSVSRLTRGSRPPSPGGRARRSCYRAHRIARTGKARATSGRSPPSHICAAATTGHRAAGRSASLTDGAPAIGSHRVSVRLGDLGNALARDVAARVARRVAAVATAKYPPVVGEIQGRVDQYRFRVYHETDSASVPAFVLVRHTPRSNLSALVLVSP